MSKKIISKISLKTIALVAVVTVCGLFCFDYIISHEVLAFDEGEKSGFTHGCSGGGGNGPSIVPDGDSDTERAKK